MASMSPPATQAMSTARLTELPGVVIQEVLQGLNVVMNVLDGLKIARDHEEAGAWTPGGAEIRALPQTFSVQEESSGCSRVVLSACGGLNVRPLKLHVTRNGGPDDVYTMERDLLCGALFCCPFEMTVNRGGQQVGKTLEDCRFLEQCCCWLYRHDIYASGPNGGAPEKKYQLVLPMSCCGGRVNNCFGATCCKPNLIMDINDNDGQLVSTVVKTYGKEPGCAGFFRCVFEADNYIVEFPEKATEEERAAIIAAVLQSEFVYFSRKGGENNK